MADKWSPGHVDKFPLKVEKNPQNDPLYLRKQELLEECKRLVGTSLSGKRPLSIAILGPPGCGKSAFLNTIFASFSNERWREHAKYGDFQKFGKQVTRRLKCYKKEIYYSQADTYLMPTFLDMTGFENEDSELNKELLNIILSGKMEENEVLSDIVNYGQRYGVRNLYKKYALRPVHRRVHRIIVVCSSNPKSNLPNVLLEAITDISSSKDITVYGVLTHADKFPTELDDSVEDREAKFMQTLGIPKTRFARIVNYCFDVDPTLSFEDTIYPSLDVPVLRLMRQILSREANDDKEPDYRFHPDNFVDICIYFLRQSWFPLVWSIVILLISYVTGDIKLSVILGIILIYLWGNGLLTI